MRKVSFARINRRTTNESLGELRPFADDMRTLAATRQTRFRSGLREWIAADLSIQPDDSFLVGTLGFKEEGVRLEFEETAFSWVKARRTVDVKADIRNVVPFAVDLREDRRWVGHALSGRITASSFANGLQGAIENAVATEGTLPVEWDVDPVTARTTVEEWIRGHPEIRKFQRTVKRSNPARDLTDDLAEMREIGARTRRDEFIAPYDKNLHVLGHDNRLTDFVLGKLEGLEKGDVEIYLEARGPAQKYTFSSRRRADSILIEEYGDDLEFGISLVLSALQRYSELRAGGSMDPRLRLE